MKPPFFFSLTGTEGIPLPYSLRTDDGISILLLVCFFLSAYVLSSSRKYLFQLGWDFVIHRERASLFATATSTDMRHRLLLMLQTYILAGICLFDYSTKLHPDLMERLHPVSLLGIYVSVCLVYLFLKRVIYLFLGWIFFDENKVRLWMESYSTLLYYLGFALFPFVLFIVYFDLSMQVSVIIGLFLTFFTKILIFYKWLKLFCDNSHGCSFLILYFCALEIMPLFLLYRGMTQLNGFL